MQVSHACGLRHGHFVHHSFARDVLWDVSHRKSRTSLLRVATPKLLVTEECAQLMLPASEFYSPLSSRVYRLNPQTVAGIPSHRLAGNTAIDCVGSSACLAQAGDSSSQLQASGRKSTCRGSQTSGGQLFRSLRLLPLSCTSVGFSSILVQVLWDPHTIFLAIRELSQP